MSSVFYLYLSFVKNFDFCNYYYISENVKSTVKNISCKLQDSLQNLVIKRKKENKKNPVQFSLFSLYTLRNFKFSSNKIC